MQIFIDHSSLLKHTLTNTNNTLERDMIKNKWVKNVDNCKESF